MLLLTLSLIACDEGNSSLTLTAQPVEDGSAWTDGDGDGWSTDEDCDDADAGIHPLQAELCDGLDNNCDGQTDEGMADADSDGLCDALDAEVCDGVDNDGDGEADEGMVDADGDGLCDALDAEACDGVDNDGDGIVDEGFDADADGFTTCGAELDCDDADPDRHPGAQEYPDGVDNDCDVLIDEGQWAEGELVITELMVNPAAVSDPVGEWIEVYNASDRTVYLNGIVLSGSVGLHVLDPDGPVALASGGYAVLVSSAEGPAVGDAVFADISLSNEGGDLSLSADGVLLDAVSWGVVAGGASWSLEPLRRDAGDNDLADSWCVATEGEGDRGTPGADNGGCPAFDHDGDGVSELEGDCDDEDADVHPGAEEIWYDGLDTDCDGGDDFDADGDGFPGGDENAADCDDTDAEISPAAIEVCDGIDNDCDGETDNDALDAEVWFLDDDGDGYGLSDVSLSACEQPDGYAALDGDCDDDSDEASPDGVEVCGDGIDNDCDGAAQFCDEVGFPIGGDASSWTTKGYYRGNIFAAEEDGVLLRFEVLLGVSSPCDLDFHVYGSDALDGEWELLWSGTETAQGEGYHSSGAIELATEADMFYSLGVGWSCSVTYYGEYDDFIGDDAGVGTFTGTHYDNSYSGSSSSYVPANIGAGTVAYDQIVYMEE